MKGITYRFVVEEDGASIVEYVLIAVLIAVAGLVTIKALQSHVGGTYTTITGNVP